MNKHFIILLFIIIMMKIINLEEVAETSQFMAIFFTVIFIAIPLFSIFKILQGVLKIKKEMQNTLKEKKNKNTE